MSDYFLDGQIPSYRSSDLTKSVKIDPDSNSIIINDTTSNKTLNINSQQLSNGIQTLLFSDIYTTVNKTPAITYPPSNTNTLNINNSIVLTDGTITNTLSNVSWTGQVATKNEIANSTHYLNFSNVATDSIGYPQKNASLSCNPSLGLISCTALTGIASSALTSGAILTLSDNTAGTYYIPFSKTTANLSSVLYVDDTTGPLSYNPSTSSLSCLLLNGQLIQPTTQNTATYASPTLSINGSAYSYRNSNIIISGTSNTISALTLTGMIVGGEYNVGIYNAGSGNITINTGLGTNIKTIYSSGVNISSLSYALMIINVLSINALTIYIVLVILLSYLLL